MICRSHTLANEFTVRHLYIGLVYHRILEGGVKTLMTEQVLNLLDGHTLVDCHGCEGSAEFVGVNSAQA